MRTTAFTCILASCLTNPGQSFFKAIHLPYGPQPHSLASASTSTFSRCAPEIRRGGASTGCDLCMAAGEGIATPGRGMGGRASSARGRGRGGRKGKGGTKQGSLIPGPPRLENVPVDKLDEIFLFKEERPGRYSNNMIWMCGSGLACCQVPCPCC